MTKSEISKVVEAVVAALEQVAKQELLGIVVEAVVAALEEQQEEPKAERPVVKMTPKGSKRSSSQNKVLWRQVQGQVRRAGNAKTKVLAKGFLKEAQKMTPLSWTSVHAQIITKGKALGVKGLAA